jgi:hypothetical protein
MVDSGATSETTISFNANGELANGIYAIRIISNGKTSTHKVIIRR